MEKISIYIDRYAILGTYICTCTYICNEKYEDRSRPRRSRPPTPSTLSLTSFYEESGDSLYDFCIIENL